MATSTRPRIVRSELSQLDHLLSSNRGLTLVEFDSNQRFSSQTAQGTERTLLGRYGFDKLPKYGLFKDKKLVSAVPANEHPANLGHYLDGFWSALAQEGYSDTDIQSLIDDTIGKTLGQDLPPSRSQEWHERFPHVDFQLYEPDSPDAVPNSYIVYLKEGCDRQGHMKWVKESAGSSGPVGPEDIKVKHEYTILNGYSAELSEAGLALVAGRPEVEKISQSGTVRVV